MRLKHFNLEIGSQLLKAMGEPTRLRILNLLLHLGAMPPSDIEFILDLSQAKTSRHLTYLRHAGILNSQKHEKWIIYSIKEEVADIVGQILAYIEKDRLLKNDLETGQTLFSNRELTINKLPH